MGIRTRRNTEDECYVPEKDKEAHERKLNFGRWVGDRGGGRARMGASDSGVSGFTFIASSMSTGGTFSPPAVMINSLIRPVI